MPEDLAQILGSLGAYGTDQGALDAAERAGVERARIEVRGNVDNIWNSILREARAHQGKLEALVGEASRNYPDQAQRLSRALVVYRQLHAGVNGLEPARAGKQATGPRSDTTKGPRDFDPFLELRRLFAIYWQPLISLIALVPTLLSVLRWAGFPVRVWPAQANLLTQSIVIGLGIITLIVIRNPKIAYRLTRWLVPPPAPLPDRPRVFRGPVSYDVEDAEQFHGRDADGETCWERLRRKPFFILEGESGCGKSSLLNVDLIPRAREVFHVVGPCRCGEDPFGKLRSALLGERYERGRNYGKEALVEAIEEVARAPANGQARPLLVCIDQFEELFVTVKDEVRRQFFETLKESIEAGRLRLVLAIRKDFSDLLLDACREVDPDMLSLAFDRESYYLLRSFAEDQAEGVVLRMLDREEMHGNDPLRQQELREFARALVLELLRPPLDARLCPEDEKRVLPVELQMVGWTYESLLPVRSFTAAELRRRGGKVGLYRDYIEDAKEYAFRRTGVPGATAILVLRRLISPAGTRWPQSVREIADSGLGLSPPQVDAVLQALAERYLVRRLPDEGAARPRAGSPPGATSCCTSTSSSSWPRPPSRRSSGRATRKPACGSGSTAPGTPLPPRRRPTPGRAGPGSTRSVRGSAMCSACPCPWARRWGYGATPAIRTQGRCSAATCERSSSAPGSCWRPSSFPQGPGGSPGRSANDRQPTRSSTSSFEPRSRSLTRHRNRTSIKPYWSGLRHLSTSVGSTRRWRRRRRSRTRILRPGRTRRWPRRRPRPASSTRRRPHRRGAGGGGEDHGPG